LVRVVGTDPGTSSLDLLLLEDERVADQHRFVPEELRDAPGLLAEALLSWAPLDLVAGPSGYGLPLVRGDQVTERSLDEMSLVRPSDRGEAVGVVGFRSWVRALLSAGLPTVFLPGGYHLPSIPPHRKLNAIDLGTADKVAVAALALWFDARKTGNYAEATFAVVEIGTAFTAILVVSRGRIVDTSAGTRGPLGLRCGGAWDGELAYWQGPLSKRDLFRGGLDDLGPLGPDAFRESLTRHVTGLRAVTPFERMYVSGAGLERPEIASLAEAALSGLGHLIALPSLPGAWVKHAAQGSALLACALAGGPAAPLAETLVLREATGSILDTLPS
jgi:predicted butyrate kinase (DUF1464 family)